MARILIVDDDPDYVSAFRDGLRSLGHEVRGIPSGHDLIPALEKSPYDIVFLDFFMEGGGADTLIDTVAAHDPALPIVVITGQVNAVTAPMAAERLKAARAVILKSSTLREIERRIVELVRPAAPGRGA